jgi:hypothetical protein
MARPSVLGSSKSGAACPQRSGIMPGILGDAGPGVKTNPTKAVPGITITR